MARIRTIKPDYWVDEKVGKLSRDARLLFIGLWSYSDDFGTARSNPALIKANIFPYDENISVSDVKSWIKEILDQGMIVPFDYNGEGFYHIKNFSSHQKVDKPSKPIVPIEFKETLAKGSRDSSESLAPEVVSSNGISNGKGEVSDLLAPVQELKNEYLKLVSEIPAHDRKTLWQTHKEFILQFKPKFIEPYVNCWNIFAQIQQLDEVKIITKELEKNITARLKEKDFDFISILEVIKDDDFFKGLVPGKDWKVDLAWVVKSSDNYAKILNKSKRRNSIHRSEINQKLATS